MGSRTPFITPALVAALVCFIACAALRVAGARPDPLPTPFGSYVGILGAPDSPAIEAASTAQDVVGQTMPPLNFDRWINTSDGKPMDTAGQVTLYRWWTDGCAHCEKTLPAVEGLRQKYGPRGLRVVAVYHPKPPRPVEDADVSAAAKALGYRGAIAVDLDWSELKKFYLSTGKRPATSASFVVGAAGVIRFAHPGPRFYPSDDPADAQEDADYRLVEQAVKVLLAKRD